MAYTHIALITGANQGIGFETAKKLAAEHDDYHVIMTGRRKEAIEEAAAKIAATGTKNVEPLVLDVRSDESIDAAVKVCAIAAVFCSFSPFTLLFRRKRRRRRRRRRRISLLTS
jgi:NADP-dependent 3-hydroxy acid dehydrogenase YdfG